MATFFDWLMDFLYKLAEAALFILPDSPFQTGSLAEGLNSVGNVMGHINYFIPVGTMFTMTTGYVGAVLVWYAVRWVLRLVKYID